MHALYETIYTGMDNLFEQPASSRLFRRISVQGVIRTIVVLRYYVIRTIVVLTQYNAAFSCGGIDGKLGGLIRMNSYARLVCIRGIKTTVIRLRGNPATAHCCVILKRYNVILPQIVFYLALLFQSTEHYIE